MAAKAVLHNVFDAKGERRSPRNYTHAVVATYDVERAVLSARVRAEFSARDTHKWNSTVAKAQPGVPCNHGTAKDGYRYVFEHTAEKIAEAQAFIAQHPNLDAFIKLREDQAEAELRANGRHGVREVISWHQSFLNADAKVGYVLKNLPCSRVEVVPVTRHG